MIEKKENFKPGIIFLATASAATADHFANIGKMIEIGKPESWDHIVEINKMVGAILNA
jgi:hypothetical protein